MCETCNCQNNDEYVPQSGNCECSDMKHCQCGCNDGKPCTCDSGETCCENKDEKVLDKLMEESVKNIRNQLLSLAKADYDNPFLQFFKQELEYAKHTNTPISENIEALIELIYLLDSKEHFNWKRSWQIINDVFSFVPMTPLTFKAEEFGENIGSLIRSDSDRRKCYQNKRNPAVFLDINKDDTGIISRTDALVMNTVATIDINKEGELEVVESIFTDNPHVGGSLYVYNAPDDTWLKTSSRHAIIMKSDFTNEKFDVPVIELYDSTDKKNDYYAFVADFADIPEDFFKYFTFTSVKGDEVIDNLKRRNIKDYLHSEYKKAPLFDKAVIDKDAQVFSVSVNFLKGKHLIVDALRNVGIGYSSRVKEEYKENEIVIHFPIDEDLIKPIRKLLEDYNVEIVYK